MIINDIKKNLGKIVINPQNAFCADNPDALVFDGEMLVGIYIPSAMEIKNANHLYRRILASRLSYLSNMKAVICTNNDSLLEDSDLGSCVNLILPEKDFSHCKNLNYLKNTHIQVELSSRFRTKILKRYTINLMVFSEILKISTLINNFKKNAFNIADTPRIIYPVKNKTTAARTNKVKVYHDMFIYEYNGKANNLTRNLPALFTESFFSEFNLDNNLLHYSDKSFKYPKIMNSELIEKNYLSDNILRHLCFYGYVPLGISTDNDLGLFFDIYKSIYNGKK